MAESRGNPFAILEVPTHSSWREIHRQGQRLLGLLAIDAEGSDFYMVGEQTVGRDSELVTWALGELEDPARRLAWELLSRPIDRRPAHSTSDEPDLGSGFREAARCRWWER